MSTNIITTITNEQVDLATYIEMDRKAKKEENARKLKELDKLVFAENKKIEYLNKNKIAHISFNDTNGYVISKVPNSIRKILDERVTEAYTQCDERDSMHYELVGNIEKQYPIPIDEELEKYVLGLCKHYFLKFPEYVRAQELFNRLTDKPSLEIFTLWVNFMKKTEFNPMHHHSGLFSFVIWHKIPYEFKTEILNSPSKRVDSFNTAGCFEFIFPNFSQTGVNQHSIMADKKYEGVICIFPSYLNHVVWPFYSSDEYRISIAGNVKIKNGA